MTKRLFVCLMVLLAMLGVCFSASAAAGDPKVAMELSTTTFSAPQEIDVSIKISNVGDTDMPGPVTLYYPNGKQVEEFGSPTLSVGASKSWTGKWNVTESQLESGKITFKMKYSIYNDAGELVNKTKNFSLKINYTGAVASLEIKRTITPTIARKGQEVTVTYDVINNGNVDVTSVNIKEHKSISSKRGTISKVPAGQKKSYTFTVKMGTKDLTSQPTITYKLGGKTQTEKKEAATIKYGEVKLTASLHADKKGGATGDTVKLTLTLKNTGNAAYQNVKVVDAVLGEVFSGQTVPAGETVTLEKDVTISQSVDYQFTISGQDESGAALETATDRVSITAVDPAQKIILSVEASANKETVYELPGIVKFNVKVTNNSAIDVSNVSVSATGVELYEFPKILAGETREFTRDVSVSMQGQYRFDAHVKNQLGETETFESNIIQMSYARPTPVPTEAPIVTPPRPVYEKVPTSDGLPAYFNTVQNTLSIVYTVALVLGGICLLLLAVGVVRRVQAIQASSKAQDHLERGTYRDYTQPSAKLPKEKKQKKGKKEEQQVTRPIGDDKAEPALPEVSQDDQQYAQDGELMAETLAKLYPRTGEAMNLDPTLTVEDENGFMPELPDMPVEGQFMPQDQPTEAPYEEQPIFAPEQPAYTAPRHRRSQK